MIQFGVNLFRGIPVEVVRKRVRRINLRIRIDGSVHLSIPMWRATLAEGERFLLEKWSWVMKRRGAVKVLPPVAPTEISPEERTHFLELVAELQARWQSLLGEQGVGLRVRRMKSLWGLCHWRKRIVTYNLELVHVASELVEYVVVHELTHLKVHSHGPEFQRQMDEYLPDWRLRRRRLNSAARG